MALAGVLASAAAAQLDVDADDLGSGVGLVASCDDHVDVAFTEVVYDPLVPGGPGFAVMKITVSDISNDCIGQYVSAGLIDENGVQIGSAIPEALIIGGPPPPIEITGASKELVVIQEPPLGFGVSAEAVEKVGVVITASNFFGG